MVGTATSGETGVPFSFRNATSSDIEVIVAIEGAVFGSSAWSRETVRREIVADRADYLVAEVSGADFTPVTIIGYGGILVSSGGRSADVQTITVVESWRRKGLGRALITTLLSRAVERGAREVFLEVRADNPHAQALYRSLGFEQVRVRRIFSGPVAIDVVVMRLLLDECMSALARSWLNTSKGGA